MSDTAHFSNAEWEAIQAAPHWILAALRAADGRSGAIVRRKERLAMVGVLKAAETDNDMVRAAADADDGDKNVNKKATYDEAKAELAAVSKILSSKVGREDGDEYRDFLMEVANQIAQAAKEGFGLRRKAVSEEEAAAIADLGEVLEATAGHKQARLNAEKADKAAAAKAAAAKRAAAARAKQERAARAKLAAEEKARDAAHAARIAAAKEKAAERAEAEKKAAAAKAEADKRAKAAAAAAARRAEAREAAMRRAKVAKEAKEAADAKQEAQAKAAAAAELKKAEDAAAAAAAAAELKKAEDAAAAAVAAAAAAFVGEHTVGGGDTLSGIAYKYYGSGVRANWMAIYEANKDAIGKNPGMIFPGQVLKIPALD
ncbi:MAG: LysM peptidoglycan-binding domain-containing protein [Candidatus Promineifilaceae bacterium]